MRFYLILSLLFTCYIGFSQKIIDKVVAVVGDEYILQSDIENQYLQMLTQDPRLPKSFKCTILEELMIQKLMVNQAEIDSIMVGESQIELQLNQRMGYFIEQIGSQEELEEYFGKSIIEIKDDMYKPVKEQLITQRMQSEIIGTIDVTPSEVKAFYKSLPEDSIPYVNGTVEISQVVLNPPYSEESILEVRKKLLDLRRRILDGESFKTLAVLYSEGPSASKGGEIGFAGKGALDPEYAKVAFSLKDGQVSKIVQSAFGFHIIQMIERKGDRVNTRHILMSPKITPEAKLKAMSKLDSIRNLVISDSISFAEAATKYSEDEKSNKAKGMAINPHTGNFQWEIDHFTPQDYYVIKDMEIGDISKPFQSIDEKGKTVYKFIQLKNKTAPHTANLKQDYNLFKDAAYGQKQVDIIDQWIIEKCEKTYIRIDDSFSTCDFRLKHWIKQ